MASWLAVAIAVGVAVVAWRFARNASYIEFHPGWNIHIDDDTGDVEVKGTVTIVSNAAYVNGKGKLIFGRWRKNVINVQFSKGTPHYLRRNEMTLEFKGKTSPKFNSNLPGKFVASIRLSDGTTKRLRVHLVVKPSSVPDKEDSQT